MVIFKERFDELSNKYTRLKLIFMGVCFIFVILTYSLSVAVLDEIAVNNELNKKLEQTKEQLSSEVIENEALSNDNVKLTNYVDILEAEKTPSVYQMAAHVYGVDPKLLEAIERLESGHYTSALCLSKNNTWGAKGADGEWKSFTTRTESTMELARCLRLYYYNQGLTTLEDIGPVYCPTGDNWAEKVRDIYNNL